jgi:hypothetical protein
MIHVVFQHADARLLREAMKLDNFLCGDVLEIKDEWAAGPLKDLHTEAGWQERKEWWTNLLQGSPYEENPSVTFDDRKTIQALQHKLDEDASLNAWIWMGQNPHDVSGYYWLIPQLKEYQGRIYIIHLHNLPFINEKGQLFYPDHVHEILPKEVIKAKKLARPVSVAEFEMDTDEWKRISDENAAVRIYEGGKKVAGRDESFYDNEILKNISGEWQKATRVLTNTLHRMKIKTGDVYLMWRMKQLIAEGKIELMGDVNEGWKAFDVRKIMPESEITTSHQNTFNNQ